MGTDPEAGSYVKELEERCSRVLCRKFGSCIGGGDDSNGFTNSFAGFIEYREEKLMVY